MKIQAELRSVKGDIDKKRYNVFREGRVVGTMTFWRYVSGYEVTHGCVITTNSLKLELPEIAYLTDAKDYAVKFFTMEAV